MGENRPMSYIEEFQIIYVDIDTAPSSGGTSLPGL